MKIHPQSHPDMQRLGELLDGLHVAMLTLQDPSGALSSRPMTPLEMDSAGAVWMMVSRHSTAALMGAGSPQVNLSFTHQSKSDYVSISGTAMLVEDAARKTELWSVMGRPWFPGGATDPDLSLLKVTVHKADIWDGPDSTVARMVALAASVVAAKPMGLGTHETVRPAGLHEAQPVALS